METMKFNLNNIKNQLEKLSNKHRLVFAASCCERLIPNYKIFSEEVKWGDYPFLRNCLDVIWKYILDDEINETDIIELMNDFDLIIPDTEDFESILTSAALDASCAVRQTLECCLKSNLQQLVEIASFAHDTLYMYIQVKESFDYNDPDFSKKIYSNSLMVKEIKKQISDLDYLSKLTQIDTQGINVFRQSSQSNIEIDL